VIAKDDNNRYLVIDGHNASPRSGNWPRHCDHGVVDEQARPLLSRCQRMIAETRSTGLAAFEMERSLLVDEWRAALTHTAGYPTTGAVELLPNGPAARPG